MAIQSYVMGPGVLELGSGPLAVQAQVAKCIVRCSEKVKTTDPEPMLSGEDLTTPDVVTLEWKVEVTIVQDLATGGVVSYTWDNAGDEVPLRFVPSNTADREVNATIRLVPLDVGGDPKTRPKSDQTWVIVGTPTLGDVA